MIAPRLVTNNSERKRLWQRIFEQESLPVKQTQPRHTCLPVYGEVPAYELDFEAFHWMELCRTATRIAKMMRCSYEVAQTILYEDMRFIPASYDLKVIEAQPQSLSVWEATRQWIKNVITSRLVRLLSN